MTTTQITEKSVEADVKAIFTEAGWASAPYMTVKACMSGGSTWSRGKENGMFQIDVWGARNTVGNRATREHMFRTTKAGVVPVEKIKEFAVERLAKELRTKAAEKARTEAINTNAVTAASLREYAQAKTGSYYSSYSSQYGGYITEDSGVSGKVKVNVGNQVLTADQARQLLDLVATFK